MPKATLKFNLPEEENEFNSALKGSDTRVVLNELDTYLRNKIKYEIDILKEDQIKTYQEIRNELHALKSMYNIID